MAALAPWAAVFAGGLQEGHATHPFVTQLYEAAVLLSSNSGADSTPPTLSDDVLTFRSKMFEWGAAKGLVLGGALTSSHVTTPSILGLLAALVKHTGCADMVLGFIEASRLATNDELEVPKPVCELWRIALTTQATLFRAHGTGASYEVMPLRSQS